MKNINSSIKTIWIFGLILLVSVVIGVILLFLSYALPIEAIQKHTISGYEMMLQEEIDNISWGYGNMTTRVDLTTDRVMLNMASFKYSENKIDDCLRNRWLSIPSETLTDNILIQVSDGEYDAQFADGYQRYWNGWLIILKPLLLFYNYSKIRIINMFLHVFTIFAVSILYYKKLGIEKTIGFLVALIIINPVTTAMCMCYSLIFYILLLALFLLLYFDDLLEEKEWHIYYFFIIGIFVSYFDFFTYPLVSLGIPLGTLLLLKYKRATNFKGNVILLGKCSLSWGVGWGMMWANKWVVFLLLCHENLFSQVIRMIKFRSIGQYGDLEMSPVYTIWSNFYVIEEMPIKFLLFIVLICLISVIFYKKRKININMNRLVPLGIVGLFPLAWYCVIQNHATIHNWLEYRNFSITFICGIWMLFDIIDDSIQKREEPIDGIDNIDAMPQ